MAIYFVSRHLGAKDWAYKKGFVVDKLIEHLDLDCIQSGDIIIGTLPIHMVAEICEKGGKYYHLILPNITRELRGKELTCEDMEKLGANVEEYRAEKVCLS